ncbi:14774_t:CDS:2 [Funneliformis mosseae]|uniref:14774_t:CDS:1 n=1 Tax=Funneliformis mosseae TaxID=27381 RepID=A0A9N9D258_FUNMO|nr:14774_t:CDS:2 [Funneliformis mosseae]
MYKQRSSQNFEDTLDITNFDSDSEYKSDVKSSSLSYLDITDSVRFRSNYGFNSARLKNWNTSSKNRRFY